MSHATISDARWALAPVLRTGDDIRFGFSLPDDYDTFEVLSVRAAIETMWDGWDLVGSRIFMGPESALHLSALLRTGDIWAGTDVRITHGLAQELRDDDAAQPQWVTSLLNGHRVNPFEEWDTFDGYDRARAVGPEAHDRAAPVGIGTLGLAESVAAYVSDKPFGWSATWQAHMRVADLLMSFPTGALDAEATAEVNMMRVLVGLGGVQGLNDSLLASSVGDDRLLTAA